MSRSKTPVLNRIGDTVFKADAGEVQRMLALGQAAYTSDRRCLRLTGFTPDKEHCGRTHTSRGGLLAVIGRSQEYTTRDRFGQVNGFKRIFAEDRPFFSLAVLDNLVTVRGGLFVVSDGCRRITAIYQPKAG